MRPSLHGLCCAIAVLGLVSAAHGSDVEAASASDFQLPFALVENAGQWGTPVTLVGTVQGVQVNLLPGALQFQLEGPDRKEGVAVSLTLALLN